MIVFLLQVAHADPTVERLIHSQKWAVVRDMVALLDIGAGRFNPDPGEPCKTWITHHARGVLKPEMCKKVFHCLHGATLILGSLDMCQDGHHHVVIIIMP